MTPLGASLTFIILSIIISAIKHFVFPSSTPTKNDQSNISLTKLYTISDQKQQKLNKSYSSFYEAYHQFHLSQVQQHKHNIQTSFMKQYNSLVMKKSIINDQFVLICQQNYLLTVSQGIDCKSKHNQNKNAQNIQQTRCSWKTQFNVYELPLLKQQTKQTISVDGRIGISNKNTKDKSQITNLECKKTQNNKKKYLITFPLSSKNSETNEQKWSLNKMFITKNEIRKNDNDQKVNKNQKQRSKNNKNRKLQAKKSETYKNQALLKKQSNKSFEISIQQYKLQYQNHIPSIYASNENGLCYSTSQEPWLIRYKIDKQWKQFNILQKDIQDKVYEDQKYESRIPPFDRKQQILIKNMFIYEQKEQIYFSCQQQFLDQEMEFQCGDIRQTKITNYLTVVYLHVNNEYRVQKFYVQLTFSLGKQINNNQKINNQKVKQGNKQEINQQIQNESSYSKLISYSLLISEMNPARKIFTDCSIKHSKTNIYQKYEKYMDWFQNNGIKSSIDTYSLLCVFRFQVDQHLRIAYIKDIVHGMQKNRSADFAFLGWKGLNKIANYRSHYMEYQSIKKSRQKQNKKEIQQKKNQNETQTDQQLGGYVQQVKWKKPQSQNDKLEQLIQIIKQQIRYQGSDQNQTKTNNQNENNEDYDASQQKNRINNKQVQSKRKIEKQNQQKKDNKQSEQKKKYKKKSSENQKKNKKQQNKNNKKKKKNKTQINKKYNIISSQQQLIPRIQISNNKKPTLNNPQYPHLSIINKYKFKLPFLLSFTQNMEIVDADIQKPTILFSGLRHYLFTYKLKSQIPDKPQNQTQTETQSQTQSQNTEQQTKIGDYRYLTLGSNYKPSKSFRPKEGTLKNQIQTAREVIKRIQQKSSLNSKQNLVIQIKDQTHPQVQNVLTMMYSADQEILNQIKSIKTIPVETNQKQGKQQLYNLNKQYYQKYLIVVWGWGIQVYLLDWDQYSIERYNIHPQQVEQHILKQNSSLIGIFLPFIQLFATFYCMFQALISSR